MQATVKADFNGKAFTRALLRWYDAHQRKLPWRGETDPYRIWISEVMLQQTRAAVVVERYGRFLRRFPTIEKLARARLTDVLSAWSGLGYYRRARGLHAAARTVVSECDGELPKTSESLRSLPGIGRYTAAAIASIAFREPVAVVDGNVERVLGRLHGRIQRDPWTGAAELLDPARPGDFNQALMELGATVCLPGQPLCDQCPVHRFCGTRGALAVVKKSLRKKRQVSYSLVVKPGTVYMVQRGPETSLMPEMWELPAMRPPIGELPLLKMRHSITNTDYEVTVFRTRRSPAGGRWIPLSKVHRLALTGLTRKILLRLSDPQFQAGDRKPRQALAGSVPR